LQSVLVRLAAAAHRPSIAWRLLQLVGAPSVVAALHKPSSASSALHDAPVLPVTAAASVTCTVEVAGGGS
jgi:hypothetical protein